MGPQRRDLPERLQRRLVQARDGLDAAQAEYEAAVLAAFEAGGSTREIGRFVNRSQNQVMKLGHRLGWPPPEVKEARERERLFAELREKWAEDPDSLLAALEELRQASDED